MRLMTGSAAAMLVLGGIACNAPTETTVTYQRQFLPGVGFDAAFDAAEHAMAERFRVSERDRQNGMIRGEDRTNVDGHPGTRPDVTSRAIRRVAEIQVRTEGVDSQIYCRVFVQENQSGAAGMVARDRRFDDQPYETPADREASTTEQQNSVWRNRSRDRNIERQMIDSIREIIGKTATRTE